MPDSSVQTLRDAFANAPAGPVVLNDAFFRAAGLTPPAGFTDAIKAAYRLPASAAGLSIEYERSAVTPAANDRFSIPGLVLSFLNAPTAVSTLYGSAGTPQTPVLGIDVVPTGWQLSDQFPDMSSANWPFALLQFDQQRFYFASAPQSFQWSAQNAVLAMQAGQNLYGLTSVPVLAVPLIQLIANLPVPATRLLTVGPVVLDKANDATILFTDMNIRALLPGGNDLRLFFLRVLDPHLGMLIETVEEVEDEDGEPLRDAAGEPKTVPQQTPLYFFGTRIDVEGANGSTLPFDLQVLVSTDGSQYRFAIGPGDDKTPITPAAVLKLMSDGAGGSYFGLVPPVLQQYLASVQLQGFQLGGPLKPQPDWNQLSVLIGSVQGQPIPLFSDPTTQQVFQLDSFSVNWLLAKQGSRLASSGLIEADFRLFPEIFRTKDGLPGGLFHIEIDSALNFEGAFTGKASLDDVLRGITGGAIGLPDGVSIDFSDIFVQVSPSRKAYSLGFQVDAFIDVPFVQYTNPVNGIREPLIQVAGLVFDLAASTPNRSDGQPGNTVYAGSMVGQLIIGPVAANVSVAYDGTLPTPLWTLQTSLAQPLVLSDLINQFFRAYDLPSFLPGTLTVEALALEATIPVASKSMPAALSGRARSRSAHGSHERTRWRSPVRPLARPARAIGLRAAPAASPGTKSSYSISTRIRWTFELTPQIPVDILAELGLDYDGNRRPGEEFAGSVIGTIDIDFIGPVQIGYRFGAPTTSSGMLALPAPGTLPHEPAAGLPTNSILWMSWKGFRAEYSFDQQTVSFSLSGWTVGSLITALVEMIGDPYFTLPAPWDILNSISLNGFSIVFDLKTGVTHRVSAKYTLPSPISLGFLTIKGLQFLQVDGKVTLAIDGSTTVPGLNNKPLFNPAAGGQDVKNMPAVPGQGNAYFDLKLLALGQRIKISGAPTFKSTQEVIKALAAIPPSSGPGMPFDPAQQKPGQPYYDRSSNWLGALHFGVLRIGETRNYAIDLMVVFNDPDLYGLRLALNGDKVKALAGLAIDVLYKKITDEIGCYQIEFTLPSVLRNLDFGAFSVTLPVIGLQIYTNGDFLVDFGFPYNMDFSRSFTVQAIIYGVPVLGSGGFYFGKLSNATAPNLPKTTKGTFNPVIVFGFGAQLGIGRYIDKGILKAGFSITVFGIIEGTLAAWHPYQIGNSGNPNEVQGDYYFRIAGTFGIIGKLYGSVDFAIIKADVSLTVVVYVKIEYESFRKIPLTLSASVKVSVSIKIDLGLLSIRISLSFSATITEQLTIGSDRVAPWDEALPGSSRALGHALQDSRVLPLPRTLFEHGIFGRPLRLDFSQPQRLRKPRADEAGKPELEITALTQFTVLAPEGANYAQQEGGLVLLFAMDAPTVNAGNPGRSTSFGALCAALLPWLIESVQPAPELLSRGLPLGNDQAVSRLLLEGILRALSDPAQAPFTAEQVLDFLAASFTVKVSAADAQLCPDRRAALDAGSTIFPAVPFLALTVPDPNADSGTTTIHLDNYVSATAEYQVELRKIFNSVAANVDAETAAPSNSRLTTADGTEPMAASVFTDYFILLARQLVQSAIDAFDDYPYPLTPTTSLQSVLDWANSLLDGQLRADPLLRANLLHPLNAGLKLEIADLSYMVQVQDTLASIASRYADPAVPTSTNPAELILSNATQSNLIAPGVTIRLDIGGVEERHTTVIGDDFTRIAQAFDLSIEQLAAQTALYTWPGLLAASIVMTIPKVIVSTAAGDTVSSILDALRVPVESFLTPANLALEGLFKVDPSLRFALPGLIVLPEAALWPALVSTGIPGQTAGTAARYMLHGMRLPVVQGLTIPAEGFLYGPPHWADRQSAYGVYQLSGQQFPLAPRSDVYEIRLARPGKDDKSNTVDKDPYAWFTLGTGKELCFDIVSQTSLLGKVVDSARRNGYKPKIPSLRAQPETVLTPTRYNVANPAPWFSSDMVRLIAVTRPPTASLESVNEAAAGPQVRPLLFGLSSALLTSVEAKQARLATEISTTRALTPYLPVLSPSVGVSDPATSQTTYSDIDDYAFATRIDFRIKQLAQAADLAPERADANGIVPPGPANPGSPARPLAQFAYEIIGPNPAEAVLLERLLTAMASEGEDLVSALFLLYADVNNGAAGLTSRADSEFLSFIVQSNLSTETNPLPSAGLRSLVADDTPPTGIANSPAEFIKLLWELSTVNSGGTFLFYQLLKDGSGLPPSLFDDTGIATLTLVVTLRRDATLAKGTRIFNAVNALLSTAPIDPQASVVQLVGVSAEAPSQALPATSSIASIADFYGIDIAGLAISNADVPLAIGKRIPISGLYRQLQPADVGPGKNPIAALAAYYSVGATAPLTEAAILAFNPGVPVEALSVFRIPPFIYAVNAQGPGSRLSSIALYYAIEVIEVGFAAREVSGLFNASTVRIDPVAFDATPNLGLTNAALELERERGAAPADLPSMPTQAEIDAYTRATLLQLYQLLSARIVASPFFNLSHNSAPFGPKDPPAAGAPASSPANAARPRRAVFEAAAEDQPYLYNQALGFAAAALINPAPANPAPGLPPASANPYIGIGTILQIGMDWQDLFGNRLPNPFSQPQASEPPPFGNLPMLPTYSDRLMPLDTWPSTTRGYRYGGSPGAPELKITLKFDPTAYEPDPDSRAHLSAVREGDVLPVWQRNAAADLAKFERVYFQLNQNYDGLGVPGLAGRAVTLTLINSLLATPEQALPEPAREALLGYVNSAILYLSARARAVNAPAPAEVPISIPVDLASITPAVDIIQLELAIRFTRQAALVSPALRALRDGFAVSASIPVDASLPAPPSTQAVSDDAPAYPVALTEFALEFEKAFVTSAWRMRVGTSSSDPSAPNNTRTPTVWAVRMAAAESPAPEGIDFRIGNTPCYFAPLPIASSLQTLQVGVLPYRTGESYPAGEPVPTLFTNVDPNVWLAECLTAIDDALSASYSTPLFQLDRLLQLDDNPPHPDDPRAGYLYRLLRNKKRLAAAIASTATPVLQQASDDLKPAAVAKLEQALLRRLSDANTLTCVAVLPVSKAHYAPSLPPGIGAPRLFGQPTGALGGAALNANDNFSLSTAKIPLTNKAGADASTLAILVNSRSTETQAYVELALGYDLTHIEHDIRNVPGIENYEQSRWITFLTGPYHTAISPAVGDRFAIPVALRALPVPATVVAQSGTPSHPDPRQAMPGELKTWDYTFSYLLQQAAQDSVIAEVVFNQDAGSLRAAATAADGSALYAALAQFAAIYPAVARDLETFLRPISGTTLPDNPDVAPAAAAIAALDRVVSAVTDAYVAWAQARLVATKALATSPKVEYTFEIELVRDGDSDAALVRISPQSFKQDGVSSDNFLPLAKVLIDQESYVPDLVSSDHRTGAALWRYLLRHDAHDLNLPPALPYETARLDARRSVAFQGLDLFALQNGWASVRVARNRHLAPDSMVKTTPDFQFTTAAARFADAIVPLLSIESYPLDPQATAPAPVANWLRTFFTGLLTPAPGITLSEPVLINIETRYAYSLVPGGQASGVPVTVVPISLLAPTSTEGAVDPGFITAVGAFAQEWFDVQAPISDTSAGFSFGLTVFSGTGTDRLPLLKVASMGLSAKNVQQR